MARPPQTEIGLRILIETPVIGVMHSLQDKENRPVDPKYPTAEAPIMFDLPVRIASGPKFYGAHVRSEGPTRRFIYIAVGQSAGDHNSCWNRRMKIDIHNIGQPLIDEAIKGRRLVGTIVGRGADGTPACATVPVLAWHLD